MAGGKCRSPRKSPKRKEGLPPRGKAEAAAAGEASRMEQAAARASPRRPAGSGRRAELRCCPLDGRPEGQSRLKYPTPGSRRRTVFQGAELPPPAATERPRRVRGEGRRGDRPHRLLLLAAAASVDPVACSASEAAADPAALGRRDRTPAPPRRGRKPGPGPRSESPGRAPAHSLLRPGEAGGRGRAGATAPQRAEVGSGSFLPGRRPPRGPPPRCLR